MLEVVFFIGLVLIFILSGFLFKSNLKYFRHFTGGYFLGLFFLLINTHAIFEYIYSYINGVENPDMLSALFLLFYGGLFYLFIKGGKAPIKVVGLNQFIKLYKSIIFIMLLAVFFPLLICKLGNYSEVIQASELDVFLIFIGFTIFLYTIKTYKLLFNMYLFSQKLRLHLLFINTFLLFLGVLLIFSTFFNLKYILFYRVFLELCIFGILVYFIFIKENLKNFFTPAVQLYKVNEDIEEFDVDLALLDLNSSFGKIEIITKLTTDADENHPKEEDLIDNRDKEKYTRSKLSDLVLIDYSQKVKDVLEQKQLYLNQDFSLEDLSRESHISKHHLGQIFSIVFETNFNRYINKLRIEYLVNYIDQNLNEQFTVNDLLAISSFKSRASFFRNFKEIVGVPPSIYLKNFYTSNDNSEDSTSNG